MYNMFSSHKQIWKQKFNCKDALIYTDYDDCTDSH